MFFSTSFFQAPGMGARPLGRDQFQVHRKLQVELYILMFTFLESRQDARIAA